MSNYSGTAERPAGSAAAPHAAITSLLWTGVVIGIGLMGSLDEIIFHQLLQWHNFYIHTTEYWRTVSDGLFHLFTTAMLLIGALLLWSRRHLFSSLNNGRAFAAGIFLGMGGFQLFDGTINHKVLQIHPVREGVENILPYDIGFISSAFVLLAIGWRLWRGVRRV